MTMRVRLQRWLVIFAVWTVVVLAVAGDCYLHGAISNVEPVSFLRSLAWAAPTWYPWALLTPLVLGLAVRLQPGPGHWIGRSAALLGCGLVIAAAKLTAVFLSFRFLTGGDWREILAPEVLSNLVARQLPVNLGAYTAIVVSCYLLGFYREHRQRELQEAQLETQLAVAEMRALKMQLHPHFVLNVLNTIAAMIHRDPERAEEMIVRMGELLRMALDSREAHTVPLADEIDFLHKYLQIERARFGSQLRVEVEMADEAATALVPNLVLQPFVENAIKHRSLRSDAPTSITVRAWLDGQRLHLQVADNGPGSPSGGSPPTTGVGIANTRARLDALYGEDGYRLEFNRAVPSGPARTSHQVSTAIGDAPPPEAFSRLGMLDVLSSTPAHPSDRKHHCARHLADLATNPGEKCGLVVDLLLPLHTADESPQVAPWTAA